MPGATLADFPGLDVTDAAAVRRAVAGHDLVINAAAMTDVDGCEDDPDAAFAVNAEGAANVAATGVRVIHLSTDYVFDGRARTPYAEDAPAAPLGVYGRSKLAGDRAVLHGPRNLVVRTSWVYGEGRNFIRAILAADRAGRPLRVVSDQVGRPTAADDLAAAIAVLAGCDASGVVNVTGGGDPCSWAELAELVVGHPVERVSTEEFGARAPRPAWSVLALDRARALGLPLADWRTSVRRYVEEQA